MDFNREQKLAITARGNGIKNILVSAGAGSGKTAVLTQRVVDLVCDRANNVNIDDLLIMTFTKNAAAQMRERIATKLNEKREKLATSCGNAAEIAHIKNQLTLLNKANITTIDSFCNNVVRKYFYKIDIDPAYRLAGDDSCQELAKLADNIMTDLFENKLEAQDSSFIMLMEFFCPNSFNDKNLREILTNLNTFLASVPYPDKWLDEALSLYASADNSALNKKAEDMLNKYINDLYINSCNEIKKALDIIAAVKEAYSDEPDIINNKKFSIYENVFFQIDELVNKCMANSTYESLFEIFSGSLPAFRTGAAKAPIELDDVFEKLKDCKDSFKKRFWDKLQKEVFIFNPDDLKLIISKHYTIISALFSLLREFMAIYSAEKNELSVVSFSDINHYCIKILLNDDGTPTEQALEFRDKFAEVIVDEYQDNNTLQEYILNAITYQKNNLFMVGDVKQSIYKFRHACPEIFAAKYNSFNKDDLTKGDICIRLNTNYRSNKIVIDTINCIFYQLMRQDFGGINYKKDDALVCGAELPVANEDIDISTANELILCQKATLEDEGTEDIAELENGEIEAHIIAQRISELINVKHPTYIFDHKQNTYRACKLSDITILMRSNKSAHIYAGILNRYGIPTITSTKYSLFDELEVKTIMALLKVLDNPYRDKELITVLHSPMFNLSCNELAIIRLVNRGNNIYENLLEYMSAANSDEGLKIKIKKYFELEQDIHTLIKTKPFCDILDAIYTITDYKNYVSIIRNGNVRYENLKIIARLADDIYNRGITDFGSIVKELSDIESKNPQYESLSASERDNAVQIMSIHRSKGLEFPIVFIAQFNKNLQRMGTEEDVIINSDMGIAFKHFDVSTRVKTQFIFRSLISRLAKTDSLTEELRLLYVALTRAIEKIIMVGVVDNIEKANENWQQLKNFGDEQFKLPLYAVANASSYLDWVMMAYYRCATLNEELFKQQADLIDINSIMDINIKTLTQVQSDEFDMSYIYNIYNSLKPSDAPKEEKNILDKKLLIDYLDYIAIHTPSKLSISEIKRQHQLDSYSELEYKLDEFNYQSAQSILQRLTLNRQGDTSIQFEAPDFLQTDKPVLHGAQRGTAYHTVFEHLALEPNITPDLNYVRAQINTLKEKHILSDAEFSCIDANVFLSFLNSSLGKRVLNATNVYRETPFVMQLKANEIFNNDGFNNTKAQILVHGIIDLYFEEDDHIILVDYKTDRVNSRNTEEMICDKYKIQLEFYKKAIELAVKKPVKEIYLYLVDINKESLIAKY